MTAQHLDLFLFVLLPYIAVAVCILGSLYRYLVLPFTYSSLSSQFLEGRKHFYGSIPFHYGIIVVLAGHLLALLIPAQVLLWNTNPLRLYMLEVTGLAFAILTVIGLVSIFFRRLTSAVVTTVTSPMDWVLLVLLTGEVVFGIIVAVAHPWGSSWFATSATPYLWSLLKFNPDASYITALPIAVKIHIAGAFLLIGILPFTRLVHILVAPIPYIWRKPQVVRWWRVRKEA